MSRPKPAGGVFAAVGTPRDTEGKLDLSSFRSSLEFLMDKGIQGFAVNGATGEYCLTTPQELKAIVAAAVTITQGRARLVFGIGSAGIHGCLENARIAVGEGAQAALLAMPHFFPYAQTDLDAFCREVEKRVEIPILLYNLPFSSRLELGTAIGLMETCPGIVGIKDSSGSLEILTAMTDRGTDALRLVGSDGVLAEALEGNYCDGVISGVAGVAPVLIQSVWNHAASGRTSDFQEASRILREFIDAISPFPVPWGLKLISEFAGIAPAGFSQPIAEDRKPQIEKLREWWFAWHEAPEKVA